MEQDNDATKRVKLGIRCYSCGSEGHLQKQCPVKNKGGPSETPGRGPLHASNKVAKLSSKEEVSGQETVADLRRKLREAELRESLDSSTTTVPCITTAPDSLLGPTLTAEVELEGSCVNALLDTGSPVTIASLEYLLSAWKKQCTADQTPEDWRRAVEKRLEEPQLTLQHYGGGQLNTVCQVKVHIARDGYSADAVVQVHKGAPTNLLLGTDLLPKLGFSLLESQNNGETVDLFSRGKQSPEQSTKPKSIPTEKVSTEETLVSSVSPAKLYVLQATRLPALHKKLVRAQVRVPKDQSLSLFVPMTDPLKTTGLKMEEAVMCPDDNECITLIVESPRTHLFHCLCQ